MSTESSELPAAGELMAPPFVAALQRRALGVTIVAAVISAILFVLHPRAAMPAYLIAFMLCLGVTLGCQAILMMQHLSGGNWGVVTRRMLEAASNTVPLMALLFVPVVIGRHALFGWSRAADVARDTMLQFKHPYLNTGAFILRAVIYFVLWWLLARYLQRWSDEQDRGSKRDLLARFQNLSGVGLVIYFFSISFAVIDWVMSLMPHWYSTVFGMLFVVGQGLASFAFLVVIAMLLSQYPPLNHVIKPKHFHDLGKLLLTFVMLWGYLAYSQLIVIWSGNLPQEIDWYVMRTRGGWKWIAVLLIFVQFALPFCLLLSRNLKKTAPKLAGLALLILVMRWMDMYWMVEPNFSPGNFHLKATDILLPIAMGGLWLTVFCIYLRRRPLLPVGDPHLPEVWKG